MARTYRQLDVDERRTFFRLVEARWPVTGIAARLGRYRSTVHRELGRGQDAARRDRPGAPTRGGALAPAWPLTARPPPA